MPPAAVVEDLEVFKQGVGQFDAGAPPLPVQQLDLNPAPRKTRSSRCRSSRRRRRPVRRRGGRAAARTLARRAERRERLAAAAGRLAAEDKGRRDAERAKLEAWQAAAAAGKRRGHRPGDEPPRPNRNNTEPRANITDPDVRVMRNQKGYAAGYNGRSWSPPARSSSARCCPSTRPAGTLLHPLLDRCRDQLAAAGIRPKLRTVLADSGYASERDLHPRRR